jgi:hypothetical protein
VIICCAIFFHFFLFILYKLDLSFRDKFQNQISQQQQQQQSQPQINNNNQNRRNVEVKKKVWSVDTPDQQQQTVNHTNGNGHYSSVQQPTNGMDVSRNNIYEF